MNPFLKLTAGLWGLSLVAGNTLTVWKKFGDVPEPAPDLVAEAEIDSITATDVHHLFATYCIDCHGPETQKGKVRLDQLDTLPKDDFLELLADAKESVHFAEMPPEDEPQPTDKEREQLLAWLSSQLDDSVDKELADKMRYPHYGNLVDHASLFSGEIKDKAYTPARRWLVSPQIFQERVMDVFQLEGRERDSIRQRGFYGVVNPFVMPSQSGVRDYDTGELGGGHLLVMMNNAKWIAGKQVFASKLHLPGGADLKPENPKDNWYARNFGPEAFIDILGQSGKPTDEQLIAAIHTQFDLTLKRRATDQELAVYVELMRAVGEIGDNEAVLTKMCTAILLKSEFLYRIEFGGDEPDESGRTMLTPREAAFAISYALGDKGPDEALFEAAQNGKLQTKADYRREVERLLADEDYYRGQVDPNLNGSSARSVETSHPRMVRFFRDFFGYQNAASVFKDPERAEGRFVNPRRGTTGTPGAVINEADMIVTWHVENDRNVFENLLASDKYFVYDLMPYENGRATVDEWREVWEKLKDTPWEKEPRKVYDEHAEYLASIKSISLRDNRRRKPENDMRLYMHFFSDHFGKGITPMPMVPWQHGYQKHHSVVYGLPPTPSSERYYSWRKVAEEDRDRDFWDYALEQPFSIPKRKGILSHPAWLIAHSHNFQTDPIKRGRWIYEKLLAGRVPDTPITVDAQVPEDPHKTFRERVVAVTAAPDCRKCHQHMNPVGLPFEMFDDFGRTRTEEQLEHPDNLIKQGDGVLTFNTYTTLPIDSSGALSGTGDPALDGEVTDALDLIDRLAKSDRVRQSIIRHAFRFYMGRNEMLSDSRTLMDADQAYLESGGSFRAVIVSLLTSDSFMYRKDLKD